MTWREIEAEKLQSLRMPVLVDVRSPCEFEAEHVPHAINIPLLTDQERHEVGLIYAREGEMVARRHGLKLIAPKIPAIVDLILPLKTREQSLVIMCWRGGLRSETVASFLTMVGIDCWRLRGGYKAWRRFVLDEFARDSYPFSPIVLEGRTGTGKTEILEELSARGEQILNLEDLAGHRGSFFGSVGLPPQPTQKNFEAYLWEQLRQFKAGPLYIESEGRKIGRISLPEIITRRLKSAPRVLITGSRQSRIKRLMNVYLPEQNKTLVEQALKLVSLLTPALGRDCVKELNELAHKEKFEPILECLLERYYDPLYDRHIGQEELFAFAVSGDDPAMAANKIIQWCGTTV